MKQKERPRLRKLIEDYISLHPTCTIADVARGEHTDVAGRTTAFSEGMREQASKMLGEKV